MSNPKKSFIKTFKFVKAGLGKRLMFNIFTGKRGGWNGGRRPARMKIEAINCKISKILFEKTRPLKKASAYCADQIYVDSITKPTLGELIESNSAKK